jgi:N-methylhydantoinase A/oxoprolinase/acetone carboxylase beta subunit
MPVSEMTRPALTLGIDTGGTYTDAAIIEPHTGKIRATAKALTTKGDYAVGVGEAMQAVLLQVSGAVSAQDIDLVAVSTTLATNAVVEGHGAPVGVVLIGFDDAMVERTKIAYSFPGIPIVRATGGHDHNGEERAPLDLQALAKGIATEDANVTAWAVASTFAVRNAAHEVSARELIAKRGAKPVTISSELSSALDAPRRALTAVLNARLIARITLLVTAVQDSMVRFGIVAPLMIVKGDGSLARAEAVALRPIETVLSGPAASLIGAKWLTGKSDLVMSDMGGTTTDIGVLRSGKPRVAEQGAEVGGWRTMVRAIDVTTIGLGGDSEVHIGLNGEITIGPQRAVPVSLLGDRYPEIIAMLEGDLSDNDGGSMHGKFVLLPFGEHTPNVTGLTEREAEILQAVGARPTALRKIAVSSAAQRAVASLRKKGLIQFACVTPSDVAHVLGLQNNWSAAAAKLAVKLAARFRDMKDPTDERVKIFAHLVWSKTVSLSARAVLNALLPQHVGDSSILDAVCDGKPILGLVQMQLKPSYPIVAVGGPVKVYYPELGRRLNCEVVFADGADVANAIGAAAGTVSHRVEIAVESDGKGAFRVQGQGQSDVFDSGILALGAAVEKAQSIAVAQAIAWGAVEPDVSYTIEKHLMPDALDDDGLLSAVVRAEARSA